MNESALQLWPDLTACTMASPLPRRSVTSYSKSASVLSACRLVEFTHAALR